MKPSSQTAGSNFFSTYNKEEYRIPRTLEGYSGTMHIYSFLDLDGSTLETFTGANNLVAFRTRDQNKEYGVLRYFELPNSDHRTIQVKTEKLVFYDDEVDVQHQWLFVYIKSDTHVVCMIALLNDIISQTYNIGRIRLETIPLNGQTVNLDTDIQAFKPTIFEGVANIDSQILSGHASNINPDDFIYAHEIRSELKSFNPFVPTTAPMNSSACFSRYPYSPRQAAKQETITSSSNLNSRMIESQNS